ncbi:GGDEF domain-containing protein [Xenophilus sp. Marseille-Q4582]|uniref:GGDEF domain-containing protein n=1 Tax=Xenophilus sp. Marseille-Q4582 TaxID=2866600 RepID=UPI001CE4681C|nr:GGDEF domain-containing protein [Xenophilus sp. Marseille-Q4582]
MQALDPKSLSTMAGLMALVVGLLLLGLRRPHAQRVPGLRHWGIALLSYAAGTACYLLTHAFAPRLATLPGNALLLVGFALLLLGSERFLGRPARWWPWMLLCGASLALIAWFSFVRPDYRVRIAAFTWTLALIGGAHLQLLLRHGQGWAARFTAGVLLCLSALMAARGTVTWWVDRPEMHIYTPSAVQGAYLATFSVAVLLLGVGVLFMATERVRAEFEFIASHDGLTQTLTRRSWMAAAQAALARPGGAVTAVFMLDVDDFKKINDERGHPAGDEVLAALAAVLKQALPADGVLGRYGGEEFAVLLTGPSAPHARAVAEGLRRAVAAHGALRCTVSIGLVRVARGPHSPDALIRRADEALYQAKRQGRNRVVEAP